MRGQSLAGAFAAVLIASTPCFAQGMFGLGARFAMTRGDTSVDPSAMPQAFMGGQLRARLSSHTTVEISLDRRSQYNADLTQRVRDYPLQGSALFYPLHSTISPYVLGGLGWYTHSVDTMNAGQVLGTDTTHKVGYHAGFGGEVQVGKHVGVHADYRYTFIHFGDTTSTAGASTGGANPATGGLASRFLPSYDGSMWTAGVTFYF